MKRCPRCRGTMQPRPLPYLIGRPGVAKIDEQGNATGVEETGMTIDVDMCDACQHVVLPPGLAPVFPAMTLPSHPGDVAAALLQPNGTRERRTMTREIDRQIGRALWRAERRGRALPFAVRQGASWVHAQRRKIAHELTRALRSLGAGPELVLAIARQACERFPRDGVVIVDADERRPRVRGDAPRQRGTNPRAQGTAPRQRGTSPRQKRAPADLSSVAITGAKSQPSASIDMPSVATGASDLDVAITKNRPLEELAPEWSTMKDRLLEGLQPEERRRALRAGRDERTRIQRLQDSNSSHH